MRRVRRTVVGAALVAAIALQAGCGSPTYTSGSDPATIAPAGARLFVDLALRPPGGAHSDAARDLQQLTHLANPYAKLAEQLLAEGPERPEYARQIEPWVGNRAGLFFTNPTANLAVLEPTHVGGLSLGTGAVARLATLILDVRDLPRARAFIVRRARQQGAQATSYRGVSFYISPAGRAEGIVANFVAIGNRAGLEQVIDTAHGGSSLKHAAGLQTPPEAIATAYVVPTEPSGALLAGVHRIWISATAVNSSLSLQGQLTVKDGYQPLLGSGGARELGALPGGSWLALGTGNVGATLPRWLQLLRSISVHGASSLLSRLGAGGVDRVLGALSSSAMALERQLARWAGPAGIYVSGGDLLELQAALIVDSSDPAASRAAVGELASAARRGGAAIGRATIAGTSAAVSLRIPGFPATLYIASSQHELVVGLGQSSIAGAVRPGATLAGSHAYATAAAALGKDVQPGAIVEFPQLLSLLEAIGVSQSPAFANVASYLKSLGTLTIGSSEARGLAPGESTIRFQAKLTLSGGPG